MNNELKQPKEYDAVLGGNDSPPINGLVLGGIEGVKHRLNKANSDDEKITILREAIKYGEAGEDFLSDVFSANKGKIQWIAAAFISATKNETYKELLVDYFADFIQNNKDDWNNWRKEVPDIHIYLKKIKFKNLTVLKGRDFSNTNLINADLSCVDLSRCNFNNASLCQANLSYAYLIDVSLDNTKLIGANLDSAFFDDSKLIEVNFKKVGLNSVSFSSAVIKKVKFTRHNLLQGCNFKSSNLDRVQFKNISFSKYKYELFPSNRYYSRIINVCTVEPEFTDTVLQQVIFDNCDLENISFQSASINDSVFKNCNLASADFSYCNHLSMNGIFENSNLENADFRFSDLRGVAFENVDLKGTDFRWCNLAGVDFTGLDVKGANFTRCTFGNNNLDKANTEGAKFSSVDSPRFPPGLDTTNLQGALFDDQHYYEPGYE